MASHLQCAFCAEGVLVVVVVPVVGRGGGLRQQSNMGVHEGGRPDLIVTGHESVALDFEGGHEV